MKYICAQPALPYFYWQIRAMLCSFQQNSVPLEDVQILLGTYGKIPNVFEKLQEEYPTVTFAFYADNRSNKEYHPSIKPYLMYRHYEANPYMTEETVFYHDCDIALTKSLDFTGMLNDDIFYLSDTVSYIGYDYIISKGCDILDKMCSVIDISPDVVKKNQSNSGGAQYLVKNLNSTFWKNVYQDSEKLYYDVKAFIAISEPVKPGDYSLQIWCAEMWATLWHMWKLNIPTQVHPALDFSWATSDTSLWEKHSIYHNAGVTNSNSRMFYKGAYINTLPYDLQLDLDPNKASAKYFALVQQSNNKQ